MSTGRPYLLLVFYGVFLLATQAQTIPQNCRYSIGMENRNIADLRISASGFLSPTFAPSKARLNIDNGRYEGEAWKPMVSNSMQWIKVDMRVPVLVTGVQTQGRRGSGEFVRTYAVKYSNDGSTWTDILQTGQLAIKNFIGNTDDDSVVTNYFEESVKARFIMIVPVKWMHQIALRFELIGCPECYKHTHGRDYRGSKNTTPTGRSCQKWTSQTPHEHKYKPNKFPNGELGDHNFCRNVENYSHAWCYTTDPTQRYEDCDIGSPGEYCGNEELLVRLVNGSTTLEGRVEVFYDGEWGTVCSDSFGSSDVKVICKMLGYQERDSNNCCKSFGPGSGNIFIDDLECLGNENSLEQCRHNGWGEHNCSHQDDIGITCKRLLRLVGGDNMLSGRVEVFHDNEWGTICSQNFNENDGRVICNMLGGYKLKRIASASEFLRNSYGQILINNMNCTGTEDSLDACNHDEWGSVNSCTHDDDAALECEQKETSPLASLSPPTMRSQPATGRPPLEQSITSVPTSCSLTGLIIGIFFVGTFIGVILSFAGWFGYKKVKQIEFKYKRKTDTRKQESLMEQMESAGNLHHI